VKWCALGAFGLLASTAFAADHRDGSDAIKGFGEADINDVYTFMTSDNERLVLIQTIGGNPGVAAFSDSVQYVFHVGRGSSPGLTAPPDDWTSIVCEFASEGTAISCYVGQPGQAAVDFVEGIATPAAGITSTSGMLKVHAGPHADPFYFYLDGFNSARGLVNAAIATGVVDPLTDLHPSGCVLEPVMQTQFSLAVPAQPNFGLQQVWQVLVGVLNGDNNPDVLGCTSVMACTGTGGPGEFSTDQFATNNVLAITIEADKTLFAGMGEYFHVYASTHNKP
jgi:hypothetical protein